MRCSACNGTGLEPGNRPEDVCVKCDGHGVVPLLSASERLPCATLLLACKLPCAECNELAARAKAEGKLGYVVCAKCQPEPAAPGLEVFFDACDILVRGDASSEQINALRAAFPGRTIGITGTAG